MSLFSLCGRIVTVLKYKVDYTETFSYIKENSEVSTETIEKTQLFFNREKAEKFSEKVNGTVSKLDFESYEWMDGLEVADVPNTYAEAVKIYKMGKDAYLSMKQAEKQQENNAALAEYLKTHHLTWTDGKQYGVTKEDQDDMSRNFTQYQIKTSMGLNAILEWHSPHEACRPFSQEEFCSLAAAISDHVYPILRKNQALKTKIYACTSLKELEDIVIDYEEMV